MRRIIINADDFGINDVVTSEIERYIDMKVISSATIMANGKSLKKVKEIVISHPEISYGVHLCLTEFESLTHSPIFRKYGITDEDGFFIKEAILKMVSFPYDLRDAIKNELSSQIEKLIKIGIPISHADSHHHFHIIYELKGIVAEVLAQYNIAKIRIGTPLGLTVLCGKFSKYNSKPQNFNNVNYYESISRINLFSRLRYFICQSIIRNKVNNYYKTIFTTTDKFYSYSSFNSNLYLRFFMKNNVTMELMCHPGHVGDMYRHEAQDVLSQKIKGTINYKLISYNDLQNII